MQLSSLFVIFISNMLAAPALSCKCIDHDHHKRNDATLACCGKLGGHWQYSEDCQASSISESLTSFSNCCWDYDELNSDC